MTEWILPDTYELADCLADQAKLVFRVSLHSLGQGTSSGVEKSQKSFSKITKINLKTLRSWDKLLQTLSLKRSLTGLKHIITLY